MPFALHHLGLTEGAHHRAKQNEVYGIHVCLLRSVPTVYIRWEFPRKKLIVFRILSSFRLKSQYVRLAQF